MLQEPGLKTTDTAEMSLLRPPSSRALAFVVVLVAVINLPTLGLLRAGLSLIALALLMTGLRELKALLIVLFALMPVRASALSLGAIGGFELTFNRVCVMVALACYLWVRSEQRVKQDKPEPILRVIAVLVAIDVLTVFLGDGAFAASAKRVISDVAEVFLFAVLCYRGLAEADFPQVVQGFGVGSLILCLAVIVERATGLNVLFRFPATTELYAQLQDMTAGLERADVLRVRGSFQNPVYLSGFLPLVAFAATYLLVIARRRALGGALLLALGMVAIFSLSRTAMYGLAVFGVPVLLWWLSRAPARRVLSSALLVLAAGGALYILAPDDFGRAVELARNPTAEEFGGADTQHRVDLITAGIPLVLELNPFGVGFDESAIETTRLLSPDVANFYVGYGLVNGIVFVACFCVLLGYMMYRVLARHRDIDWLLGALILSIAATYLSYAEYWITFPALLAFVLVSRERAGAIRHDPRAA